MKKLTLICGLFLASVLALGGCTEAGSLAEAGSPGREPGTGSGGDGGGTGGGSGGGIGSSSAQLIFEVSDGADLYTRLAIGSNGTIAFGSDDDPFGTNTGRDDQIFSYTPGDASPLKQVTTAENVSNVSVQPVIGLDMNDTGSLVAFVSKSNLAENNAAGESQIFIAATDGSSITQVTNNTLGVLKSPKLSGDGSVIVFRSESDLIGGTLGSKDKIYKINADGTELARLTDDNDESPIRVALSDDGSTVAYVDNGDPLGTNADGSYELFTMLIDGSSKTQITNTDGSMDHLDLSDDGSLVVFTSRAEVVPGSNADGTEEIYVAATDGSFITAITDAASADSRNAQISGNGEIIVFGSNADLTGDNPNGYFTIFTSNVTGTSYTQPINARTVPAEETFFSANYPQITDDGSRIVFRSDRVFVSGLTRGLAKIYSISNN